MAHAEYAEWFVETVRLVLSRLSPHQCAIFYQTDGRTSADGRWLDKSFLAHLGARAAGASCVWHRIVLTSPAGSHCFGRPGYVHMLCFSKAHHSLPHRPSVDVIEDRGHMSWTRAMGATACDAAVGYLIEAGLRDAESGEPLVVFDPFCGCGSVLAAANARGLDAVGLELSRKRARASARYLGPSGAQCGKRAARRTGRARGGGSKAASREPMS